MDNENFIIKARGVILDKGKLLVVKHVSSGYFALPGGRLEFGEDPITCLKRELVEELGVEPEIGRLLYVNTYINKNQYFEYIFEVKNGEKYQNSNELERTHAYELAEILWVSPGDDIEIKPKGFGMDFKDNNFLPKETKFIIGELNRDPQSK